MQNSEWGADWESLRNHWILDPDITFLNHGSFGACPRPVLEAQTQWREQMEARPVEFLYRRLPGLLENALGEAASFLDADAQDLVFVPNATTAVNTVLSNLKLEAGDEVLITSHSYSAVTHAAQRWCFRSAARAVVCYVPCPLPDPATAMALIEERITDRTKLVIVDHIASSTAAVFPISNIIESCRRRGVPVMVDAAHAPGMFPVSIRKLDPDFWTGNFHKWVCAPKGGAIMYVKRELQKGLHPLVTSHPWLKDFSEEFAWTGTHDPTAYLSVPAAIHFMSDIGWDRVRTYNNELTRKSLAVIAQAVGADAGELGPFISMGIVFLPRQTAGTSEELQARLYREHQIEVPIFAWGKQSILRISAQIYNRSSDYDQLAEALKQIIGS